MSDIIKSVTLDLGKKQVSLTMKQAKALKEALDEMFGEKVIKTVVHEHEYQNVPYFPWRWNWPNLYKDSPSPPNTVWCSTTTLRGETGNDVKSWNASFSDGNMTLAVA